MSLLRLVLTCCFGLLTLGLAPAVMGQPASHVQADLSVDSRLHSGVYLAAVRLKLEPGWHAYWENPGSPGFPPRFTITLPDGYQGGAVLFPVPHRFEAAGFQSYGYEEEAVFLIPITPPAGGPAPSSVTADVKWLVCEKQCVPGGASLTWKTGGPGDPALFDAALAALPERVDWPVSGEFDPAARTVTFQLKDGGAVNSPPAKLYFYPAAKNVNDSAAGQTIVRDGDSLKITTSAAATFKGEFPEALGGILKEDGGKAWRIGGPASSFSAAAAPASKQGPAAAQGWGYWLQRPLIVALLAAVMLLIALNLFGVFEIGGSLTGVGSELTHQEGLAGSFFSGALATLLATPCTAPAMGFAVTYALAAPAPLAVLIFTLIGLGMATPYLLLSAFPAWTSKLPRPGAWMETFKQTMAFPMLLVVAWLLSVVAQQISADGLFQTAAALVLVGMGAWVYGRFGGIARETKTQRIAWACAALLGLVAFQLASHGADQPRPVPPRDVESEIAALQDQGKGVFVDFTASWCVTCQANKPAIHSAEVQKAFQEKNIAFLEVDWTQDDPAVLKVLQKYGRSGVPLYLLFSKDKSAQPKELPNLLTKEIIVGAVLDKGSAKPAAELGLWAALGGAFLGGIILNLMPCVFPVITLKIMSFVSQAGEDRRRILLHGLAFTAGVLVFFWIITAVLLSARAALPA